MKLDRLAARRRDQCWYQALDAVLFQHSGGVIQ